MSAGHGKGREPARCLACTKAARARARAPHGTKASYSSGCRCDACKEAQRLYMRDYMRNRRRELEAKARESA